MFNPAIKELGWSDVTLHNLRHTCASLLISDGAPITTVSKVLGHASVVQTLSTYSHYYQEVLRTSMASIGALYESVRGSKGDFPNIHKSISLNKNQKAAETRTIKQILLVGPDGLEPSTHGLKVRCSTN